MTKVWVAGGGGPTKTDTMANAAVIERVAMSIGDE
jgi:hypothetical protein